MEFAIFLVVAILATVVGQLLIRPPKNDNTRPAGLGDFAFPTTTEARPLPIVWGTVNLVGPNVLWYGDLQQVPINQTVRYSMLRSASVKVGFQYFLGFQVGLCRGPAEIRSITWDETKIWDVLVDAAPSGTPTPSFFVTRFTNLFGGNQSGNGGVSGEIGFMSGAADQPIDPYIAQFQESAFGTLLTPTYAGTCGLIFKSFYVGNSPQVKPLSVELRRIPNGLLLAPTVAAINDGNDANPANVLYELITDAEMGNLPASLIDVANFTAAAQTLADEGNGFSFIQDQTGTCEDVVREIERQINGTLRWSPRTGLYEIKLWRADYEASSLVELDERNVVTVDSFNPGLWNATQNQLNLLYFDRSKNYARTPAWAQDRANALIQGGQTVLSGNNVKAQVTYAGVKDGALANQLAWRDVRLISKPRAQASITVTHDVWAVQPGDVVAVTIRSRGLFRLPMRVASVQDGDLTEATIRLDMIEDVAATFPASGGAPPASLWAPPSTSLQPFNRFFIMEAPNAINTRNPKAQDPLQVEDHVMAGASALAGSIAFSFEITGIDLFGFPDGAFFVDGAVQNFAFNLTLTDDLPQGDTQFDLTLTANSAFQRDAFLGSTTRQDGWHLDTLGPQFTNSAAQAKFIGQELNNLLLIDDEFFLFEFAEAGVGDDVILRNCYRGVMDTVQAKMHLAGARAFLVIGIEGPINDYIVSSGINLSLLDTHLEPTDPGGPRSGTYDVRLLPGNGTRSLGHTDVAPTRIVMQSRSRRALPPGQTTLGGVADGTTADLEQTGSGDSLGVSFSFVRRDPRMADIHSGPHNEVLALTADASTLFAGFPTTNNTLYTVSVYLDPLGADTLLYSMAATHGPSYVILRDDVLRFNGGAVPDVIGIKVHVTQDFDGATWGSLFDLEWVATVTSELQGGFVFGAVDANGAGHGNVELSHLYAADAAGTYTFTLYSAMTTGAISYSKNSGSWTTLLSSGSTTLSLVVGDSLQLRHTDATIGQERLMKMTAPGSGTSGHMLVYRS